MTDTNHLPDSWQEVVSSMPGGVGIQECASLVYASPRLATIVGAEPEHLIGGDWRTLVGSAATEEVVHNALETARTDGHWKGSLGVGAATATQQVDVALVTLPANDEIVLWLVSNRDTEDEVPAHSSAEGELHSIPSHVSPTLAWTILDKIDDVVYVINEEGEFSYWNNQLVETTGYSHEEIQSMQPAEFVPQDQQEYVPGLIEAIEDIRDRRVEVDILTKDGERITHEFSGTTFAEPETNKRYRCGVARDLSERLEHKRALERQRDELATLNRINDLLFETAWELIQTGSRSAVEKAVCNRLAASGLYDAVWIGERDLTGEGFVSREATGIDTDLGTDRFVHSGRGVTDPVSEATQTGTVAVVTGEDASLTEWATATQNPDIASLVAVPLQHAKTVYGVLVVMTTRGDAFSPQEQAGFEVLGELIGVVIYAARSQELLFADTIIELEFDFTESDSLFVETARRLDCQLTLDGYVPSEEGWIMYLTAENTPPEAVVTTLSGYEQVIEARRISGEGATGRIEAVVTGVSVLQVVNDAGATVQQASATPETARFVVEAPIETDVRRFVDNVGTAFPAATLFATRKCDRDITTVGRPGGLLAELTDRQREVLEAAYQAGYFAWPRESTAEEVAHSLGLSSATLHGHLRKAEQVILAGLLDG